MSKQENSRRISLSFELWISRFLCAVFASSSLLWAFVPQAVAQSTWTHKGVRARYGHSAVFDSATGKLIIFGGQHTITFGNMNDTFWGTIIAGSAELIWTPITTTGAKPSSRFGHTAIYDSTNLRMVVFGGGLGSSTPAPCENDLWVLQNANGVGGNPSWKVQATSGISPLPRFGHTAVYDSAGNNMIVFGGYDCTSTYLNDVWVLSNANGLGGTPAWMQLATTGAPPSGREAATAVYDQTNNLMIVYGGDSGSGVDGDIWVLSNANGAGGTPTWTQLFPTGAAPVSRSGHSAIYDPLNNVMTLYAGQTSPAVPVTTGSVAGLLNDFWVLTNANGLGGIPAWTQLTPQPSGMLRSFHSAAYDASNNTMLIFGGKTNVGQLPSDDHITIITEADGMQP